MLSVGKRMGQEKAIREAEAGEAGEVEVEEEDVEVEATVKTEEKRVEGTEQLSMLGASAPRASYIALES